MLDKLENLNTIDMKKAEAALFIEQNTEGGFDSAIEGVSFSDPGLQDSFTIVGKGKSKRQSVEDLKTKIIAAFNEHQLMVDTELLVHASKREFH